MSANVASRRVLWNSPQVVGFFTATLLITLLVVLFQLLLRRSIGYDDGVPVYYRLFLFQDYPGSLLYVLALVVALIPTVQSFADNLVRRIARAPLATAAVAVIVLSVCSLVVVDAQPVAMDEVAPYMQSQIFASGALTGRFPPELLDWLIYPNFQNYFIHMSRESGAIASSYWPGFALLLTPFMAAGVPWVCNPVIAALAVLVVHRMTKDLTGSILAAGIAVLFLVASPVFTVNASTYYAMTAHLLCNAVFSLLLFRPTPARAAAAGLVGGLSLTLHNPVPHILFAAPWLLWLLMRKDRWILLPAIVAGYLPWVVVVGFGWHQMIMGLKVGSTAAQADLSIGSRIAQGLATFLEAFRLPDTTMVQTRMISTSKLWLWAVPGLMLLAAAGFWRGRSDVRYRLLLASGAMTFVGYLFVRLTQGHGWGYRYFHSAWFVLPVLAAAGSVRLNSGSGHTDGETGTAVGRYVQGAAVAALLILAPYWFWQVHGFVSRHLAQLPEAESGVARVIIVNPSLGYYAQDLGLNDPFLRDPVIRLISRGPKNDEEMMAKKFPQLTLIASDYRGTVWGFPMLQDSATPAVLNDHREKK